MSRAGRHTGAGFLVVALLVGCVGVKPQKGGKSEFSRKTPGETNRFAFEQPENPATGASQEYEATEEIVSIVPVFSREGRDERDPAQPITSTARQTSPVPQPTRETSFQTNITKKTTRAVANIGPAQKDTSRELAVRLKAMKPVQWVGIGLVLVAGFFLWRTWFTPAAISGGTGIGFIFFANAFPGHERPMLVLAIAAAAILATFRAYEKGQLDRFLPDALDKNPTDKNTK